MPCIQFREIRFSAERRAAIDRANGVIEEYSEQGLRLTLRQLYYQHVARGWIPNTERSYKNLGEMIASGRLAGLIDWDAIEDRGREADIPLEFSSIGERVAHAMRNFRLPRWEGQEAYAELWVEKQALAGVLAPIAHEFHATLMVNKGYSSASAMYQASRRYLDACAMPSDETIEARGWKHRKLYLFYLGDHDPSGEDMVRDIRDRMALFGVERLHVEKLALTIEQVRQYNPPPNPAKMSDSRAAAYVAEHGRSSWEVDALPPQVLTQIIRAAFRRVIDRAVMGAVVSREDAQRARLQRLVTEHFEEGD